MTATPWTAAELGQHLSLAPTSDATPIDLGHVGPLLTHDDPRISTALSAWVPRTPAGEASAIADATADALCSWLAVRGAVSFGDDATALAVLAGQQARASSGRTAVLALDPLVSRPADALPVDHVAARAQLDKGDVALLVFEPRVDSDAAIGELRDLLAHARARGTRVLADETRTAGRAHAASSARAMDLPVDALLLGHAVACCRPFAALVTIGPLVEWTFSTPAPDVLALALARATADELARVPVHDVLAEHGRRLARAFGEAMRREQLVGGFVGPAAVARLHLPAQEGVAAPLLRWHFQAEMQRFGATADEWLVAHARSPSVEAALAAALDAAVGRLRTRLIENNSYLSGGLPYVFATAHDVVRQRGLARYRYPRRAEVDVTTEGDRVRIAFAAGELGPIVSSGFFVPTHVRGDFAIEADYELRAWSSGPDSACFGLFFQNDLSTGRYYAQRTAASDGSDGVLGSFDGVVTPAQPVRSRRGTLRLVRQGRTVRAAHREPDGAWCDLGSTDRATADDGIFGAKIWSKQSCEGLVVDIVGLRIDAQILAEQGAMLPERPDPRRR